jgi:hypothetical protein
MGPLTQAMAALKNNVADLRAIQGLPQQAVSIQTAVCESLTSLLSDTPAFQAKVLTAIGPAKTGLDNAIAELAKGGGAAQVSSTIAGITSTISGFQTQATSLLSGLNAATTQVTGSFTTLSNVEGSVQSQIATLQGQVNAAKGQLEAAQKRYYYLLALGPLGLAGLAIALGLFLHWRSQVSDLQNQVNALNDQIRPLQLMIGACKSLAANQGIALQRMTNVKNVIDTAAADFTEVLKDLSASTSAATLELLLRACQGMLVTLEADVS